MAGSGRSNVGTAVVAAIALPVVALPQALLATTQECEETQIGTVWTCTPSTDWVSSGQTIPANVMIATPGDSAEITVNTDLVSTEVYSEPTSPSVTTIETAEEEIHIIPELNLVKITRDGETEEMLASSDPDAPYELKEGHLAAAVIPPDPDENCNATIYLEGLFVDVDPGSHDPSPDREIWLGGEAWEREEGDTSDLSDPTNWDGENWTIGPWTKVDNPTVLNGSKVFPWDIDPPGLTDYIYYEVELKEGGPDGEQLDSVSGEIEEATTTVECDSS